jgi:hypothetical protein
LAITSSVPLTSPALGLDESSIFHQHVTNSSIFEAAAQRLQQMRQFLQLQRYRYQSALQVESGKSQETSPEITATQNFALEFFGRDLNWLHRYRNEMFGAHSVGN